MQVELIAFVQLLFQGIELSVALQENQLLLGFQVAASPLGYEGFLQFLALLFLVLYDVGDTVNLLDGVWTNLQNHNLKGNANCHYL